MGMKVQIDIAFQGGIYWITLVDWYCASFTVIIVCFCQICIFSYTYGK